MPSRGYTGVSVAANDLGAEAQSGPAAMGIRPEMPFTQRVEALIKFTRLHLLPFKLVEDDEKMTFIASPCPSGGRQVLAGLYQPGGPGEMIEGESAVTYNRREMPAYCCHESALALQMPGPLPAIPHEISGSSIK